MTSLPRLENIISMFQTTPKSLRLQLLLEFSRKVPALPVELKDNDHLERVHECQTPFFLMANVVDDKVHLFFDAPEDAPTTRGFAGILYEGLEGESYEAILNLPMDFYEALELRELISPLRLRGMEGILFRLKRQVKERLVKNAS